MNVSAAMLSAIWYAATCCAPSVPVNNPIVEPAEEFRHTNRSGDKRCSIELIKLPFVEQEAMQRSRSFSDCIGIDLLPVVRGERNQDPEPGHNQRKHHCE